MTTNADDVTVTDVDAFVSVLAADAITVEVVESVAVALHDDDPSIEPESLKTAFVNRKDLLDFLCKSPDVVVNAITNNVLFRNVGAGKGKQLLNFLCHLSIEDKENEGVLDGWQKLETWDKEAILAKWRGQ